ncbi:TraQ conjugal transfer family protein [Chryseobacterium sp. SL1]|uniref:TraQ conjugal transfer family protein n=1 Tax=Chryseobacterium sp. SL1 TaxID=2995159 RepID=UPI002275A8EE|nr:TraQ conjugal transfer family protein [Chryseobacterium sp. SL1]MCY1662611.1 TraQ conjugal transfer family protein [Chryseobacterium sp. SL1]
MNTFETEKRSFINRLIFIASTCTLLFFIFSLHSCEKELDIQTDFPFQLEVLPVPKSIGKGETVTIRCSIKTEGYYEGLKYKIRYFQFDGTGKLIVLNKTLKPNDPFSLPDREFIVYYISESIVTQSFDIWVTDNKGNEQKLSFQFNAKDK